MYSSKVMALALANAGKKIKFKENSPFKDFIVGTLVKNEVNTPLGGIDIKGIKDIAYNNIKVKYSWYKLIQTHLREYVSKMEAFVAEFMDKETDVLLKEFSVNKFLEKMIESGKMSSKVEDILKYSNADVAGSLLNPEMSEESLAELIKHPLLENGDIDFDDVQDVRFLIKNYLSNIPVNNDIDTTFSSLISLIQFANQEAYNKIAVIIIMLDNLINNPMDGWFANGVTGHVYVNTYKPILANLYDYVTTLVASKIEEEKHNIENKQLVKTIVKGTIPEVIVYKDVYKEYLEQYGELNGAVDAILALVDVSDEKTIYANIETFSGHIPELAKMFSEKSELTERAKKEKKNVKIATEFTDQYLKIVDEMITASSEVREMFLDLEDKTSLPTPEDVINIAYNNIKDEYIIDPTVVRETCFKILESVFNCIDPFLGTFIEGLSRTEFNGKKLESVSLTLGGIMEVYADMIVHELEIVDLYEPLAE